MVRRDLLIGKLKTNGLTYISIAEKMGCSTKSVANKLRSGYFVADEILILKKLLNLNDKEFMDIFFYE